MKYVLIVIAAVFAIAASAAPVPCGSADDTPATQAALDAGLPVEWSSGICRISSLNATNRTPMIVGAGPTTKIYPIKSGVNVIDLIGSGTVRLRDFQICGYCTPGIVPKTGILTGASARNTSDMVSIDHVRIDGNFSVAALYIYQTASSSINVSQFYNYQRLAVTIAMTGNNLWGITSDFTTINPLANAVPSDWSTFQLEVHNFGSGAALWIGGARSIRAYGGNMSSSQIPVSINAVANSAGGVSYPQNNIFDGTTFYSDFPPNAPCAIQNNAGPSATPILRGNDISMPVTVC